MRKIVLRQGEIDVPPGVDTADFAEMESLYRDILWPRVPVGHERYERRLWWNKDRTELYYLICDVPKRRAKVMP